MKSILCPGCGNYFSDEGLHDCYNAKRKEKLMRIGDYELKWSWLGFIVGCGLVAITMKCATFTHNYYYKQGFTDGVQSRIDYEQGKDVTK
jgi:hypothetical protein